MAVLETIVVAFWAMLPAYVPNNAAVLAGGGRPIDGGRTLGDSRLLGDGKTWRGTAAGILAGAALAAVLTLLADDVSAAIGIDVPAFTPAAALGLAAGAMLGDILASFLKRRTGRERGAMFPGLDQLDFVVVSLPLTALVATEWFLEVFTWGVILAVVVLTPVLHVGTNVIAYKLGLKDEPW
ncbi:CDP-2,3-bis-(O-geranylgeranyl)-sn-glycerol synthase [Natrialbaceae archaeon AArc-T1-2]|uniref:CDP-2,3-bis-(O-geranylgeranyl)-sn-glycerol synthase n=1 Tax=Natrialbaceae archaeon AArc-T1-2 TaxID=3053904 RepID=UPI00255AE27D|nr:CDP-2,3-bis-(O-geranylgeranyl)-sn-glycerol synthase [Natrialbaceae archaeon AArc-T1-2]WIV67657.1 CDP-2,3-bis-(O-geranylgeranyl)-sn-glycerol synthase [Natrialbaceae archaeon AArc-T1-2]